MNYWLIAGCVIAVYLVFRLFLVQKNFSKQYERELLEILNKDEHKVKGRFE